MPANEIVLYITLGFMLVCFAAWLWQSISKRRKLEDEIEEEKENNAAEKADKHLFSAQSEPIYAIMAVNQIGIIMIV